MFSAQCTYASRLRSESGISSGANQSSTRPSLSYLEACLLGRTDSMDIAINTKYCNDSKPYAQRIKPAAIQHCVSTSSAFAADRRIGWFTNGLETRLNMQVRLPTRKFTNKRCRLWSTSKHRFRVHVIHFQSKKKVRAKGKFRSVRASP